MPSGQKHIVEIVPNSSLSPRGALYFYLIVVISTVLVSGSAAALGFWPVLPFAGAELALLGAVLIFLQRRARYREVVCVNEREIVVEKGENHVQERLEFVRHWTRVELRQSASAAHVSRLALTCQGQRCEIGECLTETERVGLARRLNEIIGPVNTSPPLASLDA